MNNRDKILYQYKAIYDLDYWFEKLHRYVFDYCYQSDNQDWGVYTPYKKANANNPYRKYNSLIEFTYRLVLPFFKGWRERLVAKYPYVKKYERYKFA